ncbi:MAG TPA: hypothetical protein VGD58_17570 [Herpetosiphonaceae bacterium]
MQVVSSSSPHTGAQDFARYPLLDALIRRRSRRFAHGMHLDGGPLAYASTHPPQPLSLEEEAALAFAACGITGHALGDLPYRSGVAPATGGGNIMTHFVGRTVPSGDSIHSVVVFVINDEGVWLLKRPQDYARAEIGELIALAGEHRLVELYLKNRVQIAERRLDVPRDLPFVPPFNKWSSNVPGTTLFLPVNETTTLYINMLLAAFDDDFASFVVDERNRFQPAGIGRFARSRGGHLYDDPKLGRVGTIGYTESWIYEFTALEQGAVLQNLALMAEALGLSGFAHFAAYPYIWMQTLGFRMEQIPLSRTIGAGPLMRLLLRALKRDDPVPTAVGLQRDDEILIKPFCPPYYPTMRDAVLAFVDYKFGTGRGTFRDGGSATGWRDGAAILAEVPPPGQKAIDATIAYCEYVYRRYGRFPTSSGPFRTVLAYQAHHVDADFYDRFYRPEALNETQRRHGSNGAAPVDPQPAS